MEDSSSDFMSSEPRSSPTPTHPVSSACPVWRHPQNPAPGTEGYSPFVYLDRFETSQQLLACPRADDETIFSNLQEATDWRSAQIVGYPPAIDPTLPRTLKQKRAHVKLLFKAWKSIQAATDNSPMLKAFEDQKHDNRRVETLCWMILEACLARATLGPLLQQYDPSRSRETPGVSNFATRFNEIVTSLREQKTLCKHLLDPPYLCTFIDDPVRARGRVASNRALNKRKSAAMSAGRRQMSDEPTPKRRQGTASDTNSDDSAQTDGFEGMLLQAPTALSQVWQTTPLTSADVPAHRNPLLSPPSDYPIPRSSPSHVSTPYRPGPPTTSQHYNLTPATGPMLFGSGVPPENGILGDGVDAALTPGFATWSGLDEAAPIAPSDFMFDPQSAFAGIGNQVCVLSRQLTWG